MGTRISKEISKAGPLGCVLAHWGEITDVTSMEDKKMLLKNCGQW